MPVHRCPKCALPYLDTEIDHGVFPCCSGLVSPSAGPPAHEVPTTGRPDSVPGRGAPFLLGMLLGCLVGAAGLWAALRPGEPSASSEREQSAAPEAMPTRRQRTTMAGPGGQRPVGRRLNPFAPRPSRRWKQRNVRGWNEVLAKVDNIVGTWELYLKFRTADGRQPLNVISTSAPPPRAVR
jgi:hypothetical protein